MAWIKNFLQKNLRDSRAFVDNIWSKFKRDSQYQSESALDWASHLEHLQSILLEFDADGAPREPTMIRYFREGLKPSIKAEIDQRDRELDSFEELVQKAVNAEAKAALRPCSTTREMDQHCPWGTWPANSTVAKGQGNSLKDPRVKAKPKSRAQESKATTRDSDSEDEPTPSQSLHRSSHHSLQSHPSEQVRATSDKKTRREKKQQRRRDYERAQINSGTPNASGRTPQDLADVACFNCDRKGHYARNCP